MRRSTSFARSAMTRRGVVALTVTLLTLASTACGGSKAAGTLRSIEAQVRGLAGPGLILSVNDTTHVAVNQDGPVKLASLPPGSRYVVTVEAQPVDQKCAVSRGEGEVGATDVTDVEVRCEPSDASAGGGCVITPGHATLAPGGTATTDILFVVDDSGSMEPKQAAMAENFGTFIDTLAEAQAQRATMGIEAVDYHIAVTTSSMFEGWQTSAVCTPGPTGCYITPSGIRAGLASYSLPCDQANTACVDLAQDYYGNDCSLAGQPYPKGDFFRAGGNPRVLHFTRDLNWASAATDPTILGLVEAFKANIRVGACGSGMEQHLEAGKEAVRKSLAGLQPDSAGEWPHDGAKLVIAFVGDEEDCSHELDATRSLPMGNPGNDACSTEAAKGAGSSVLYPVQTYVDYFSGLGKQVAAGFVFASSGCSNWSCTPGSCSVDGGTAYSGLRFKALSTGLKAKGVETFEASICDTFQATLQKLAEVAIPEPLFTLPSLPANKDALLIGIEGADGAFRQCTGPSQAQGWTFADCATGAALSDASVNSGATTNCLLINRSATGADACMTGAGEKYAARYLGRIPADGCTTDAACATALGGEASQWTCKKETSAPVGTCICKR